MKILSWNINGLRAILKKDFKGFLEREDPDVLCLQEIKIDKQTIGETQFDFSGYEEFYNPAERKGYSGTAILLKSPIYQALKDFGQSDRKNQAKDIILPKFDWDDEGRVQIMDLGGFYLVNIYFPNANHELSRLDFKIKFNDRLMAELKNLEKGEKKFQPALDPSTSFEKGKFTGKPLIVCGDYNVAHEEIDLARPKENVGNPGFHPRERAWMDKFLAAGFIDSFRHLHPGQAEYSWWSYRANARTRNVGWRIDYFCVSRSLAPQIQEAAIMGKVFGSDHCPVGLVIEGNK